jgi:hypothetical protein
VGRTRTITVYGKSFWAEPGGNAYAANADASDVTAIDTEHRGNATVGNRDAGTANAGGSAAVVAAVNGSFVQRGRPEAEQPGLVARKRK